MATEKQTEKRRLTPEEFLTRVVWDGCKTGVRYYNGSKQICGAMSQRLEGPNGEPIRCEGIPHPKNGRCNKHSSSATHPGAPSNAQKRLTAALIEQIEQFDDDGVTEAQKLARALIEEAKNGNGAIAKIVVERIDGPVKQELDVTSGGEALSPIQVYLPENGRNASSSAD